MKKTNGRNTLKLALVFCCALIYNTDVFAQIQADVEGAAIITHNSTSSEPQLNLNEDQDNAFARLFFTSTATADRWALSGKVGTTDDKLLGFYFNGSPRLVYNETDGGLGLGTSEPLSLFHVSGGDIRITGTDPDIFLSSDGATDSSIAFGDNSGTTDARMWYDSSEDQLNLGTNTVNGNILVSGDGKVGVNENDDLDSRMTIKANSGTVSTPAQLDLRENNNSDYARLKFSQFNIDGSWDVGGKGEDDGSAVGDPLMKFSYQTGSAENDIFYIDGDDERLGINDDTPDGSLSIKQISADAAIVIENNTDTDQWSFEIGSNDLFLDFNGVAVGRFDDASGDYIVLSDGRFKNNINDLEDGTLEKLKQIQPKKYFYNHAKNQETPSYGYIAQDLAEVFPDAVIKAEEGEDTLMVSYAKMGVVTTKAVQELSNEVDELKMIISQLKTEIENLKSSK